MLTWEQDLAYRRMLDLYYLTEKPLPADRQELYSLLRATTKPQQAAVEYVLGKYWRKPAGRAKGFVQQKALKELRRYRETQAKRVSAANQRWLDFSKSNAHALHVDTSSSHPIPSPHPYGGDRVSSDTSVVSKASPKNSHPKGEKLSEKERRTQAAIKSAV